MKIRTTLKKLDSVLGVGAQARIGTELRGTYRRGNEAGNLGSELAHRELLAASLGGEHVELKVEALTSLEPIKPSPLPEEMRELANANFSRFTTRGLRSFVRSFKGRPFLRDHNKGEIMARGGRIVASSPADNDAGDVVEFRQVLEVVKPWAVQGILDGTIETFSIGWMPKDNSFAGFADAVSCSVCRCSLLSFDCAHFPGDVVENNDSGERVIVEATWDSRKIVGVETSAVTFPAVSGTKVEDFQQALATARSIAREIPNMDEIRKLLKLSEDATKADILAAITKLQEAKAPELSQTDPGAEAALRERIEVAEGKSSELETLLGAEQESHKATQSKLEEARAELAQAEADKVDALVERAFAEGRIRPQEDEGGSQVTTEVEKAIRMIANRTGLEAATGYVEALPVIDPIGQRQTQTDDDNKTGAKLSAVEKSVAQQLGLTDEEYLEHNPQAD